MKSDTLGWAVSYLRATARSSGGEQSLCRWERDSNGRFGWCKSDLRYDELARVGRFDAVRSTGRPRRGGVTMRDLAWLVVAVVAGLLAAVGWIARERWIMRRRR